MAVRRYRIDSVAELRAKKEAEEAKDAQITEQTETIELLKGCIMELAEIVYGEETAV